MRTEFEKLPEINRYIRMYCVFNSKTGNYEAKSKHNHLHELRAEYVNGARMAYQEQQKRIDAVLNIIAQSELHCDRSVFGLQDEIKELLK